MRTACSVHYPSGFLITALCPKIVPGPGVGVCGFSFDGLMRGSQAGDPDLALTARQCGRDEGSSYMPHFGRHWLVWQSRCWLAPPHSLLTPKAGTDRCQLGG